MNDQSLQLNRRVFIAGAFELLLGVIAVGLGWWVGPDPHAKMPRFYQSDGVASGLFDGLLLGILLLYFVLWIEKLSIPWIEEASQAGERMFLQLTQGAGLWHYFSLSLAAGVGEELLFRGWFQSFLQIHLSELGDFAPWLAIVLASIVFGIVHPVSKGYILLAFVLSLFLGTAYYLTDNILVPIVGHTVYDFIMMIRMATLARYADKNRGASGGVEKRK